MKIYAEIHALMLELFPEILESAAGKTFVSKVSKPNRISITLTVINRSDEYLMCTLAELAHKNTIPDPIMEIKVALKRPRAEAVSYKDPVRELQAYPAGGGVDPTARDEINRFLRTWLGIIKMHQHDFKPVK